MTLRELIDVLGEADPNKVVPIGWGNPHSYRGYYDDLAFEPMRNVRVADMLHDAEASLNATFAGYKGGEFVMNEYVDVYLANYGECGDQISRLLLHYMGLCDFPVEDGEEGKP